MPHRQANLPTYRLHKASGQAVVTLDGRDCYLGTHGTPESRAKYQRLIRDYVTAGFRLPCEGERKPLTIAHLCDGYLSFAEREYRLPDGSQTGTVENTKLALRALFEFAADLEAEQFGPRMFLALREKLVGSDLARSTINDRLGIVRRAFKWAAEQERIPASVYHGLLTVRGLRRGRGGARETEPVRPVPEADVERALPFMPEPVQAMVRLQLLTGARPGEIVCMRASDIDRSGKVWVYRPVLHKNSWRGQDREVYLGPRSQEIVRAWMRPGLQERFLFSPIEAERLRHEHERSARRTPLYPSHIRAKERKQLATERRILGERYDVDSYRQAIARACLKAGIPPWAPNRLRHNSATQLRREFGLDVAKAVLGHQLVETTQIYAEVDRARAMEAIERVG
jgi:integrase